MKYKCVYKPYVMLFDEFLQNASNTLIKKVVFYGFIVDYKNKYAVKLHETMQMLNKDASL